MNPPGVLTLLVVAADDPSATGADDSEETGGDGELKGVHISGLEELEAQRKHVQKGELAI